MADSQGSPDKTIKKELEKVRKLSDGVEQKLDGVELKCDQLIQSDFSSKVEAHKAWQQVQDLLLEIEWSESFQNLPEIHEFKTRLSEIKLNIENSLSTTKPSVRDRAALLQQQPSIIRSISCASINLDAPSNLSSRRTRQSVSQGLHSPPSSIGLPVPKRKQSIKMSTEGLDQKTALQELQEALVGTVDKESTEYKEQAKVFTAQAKPTISLIQSTQTQLYRIRDAVEQMVTTEYFEDAKWQIRAVQDCKEGVEACKRSYTQLSLKKPTYRLVRNTEI